ncbi:MAG: glycoside hydrolase family 5 protein [Clostridia bacterium]|nr:glycoside hydrolase family 5 protein [Clostridia bacterium]
MTENTPARRLVSSIHAGWNLGNSLDAMKRGAIPGEVVPPREAETAWHNPPVDRELIRAVRDAGFDAVRLPVTWVQHMDRDGKADPAWMDRVAGVAGWILDEGMACFLNVHHDAGAHGWLQATERCHDAYGGLFEGLWRQIAERFHDTGEGLVFEAFNEMLDGRESWSQTPYDDAYEACNRWTRRFVETVRSAGGENRRRLLSLQTYSAGHTARTLEAFRLPADPAPGRIILQVHNYDPQSFCWMKTAEGRENWGGEADEKQIEDLMECLSAFSEKHDAPLVIGEFGSEDKGNEAARERHAAFFVSKAGDRGIPCFWWDCGRFALFDRNSARVIHPGIVRALTGQGRE